MNKQRPFIHKIMTKQQATSFSKKRKSVPYGMMNNAQSGILSKIESKEKSKEELKDESNEYSTK